MSVQARPQFSPVYCLLLPQAILTVFIAYRFSLFWRITGFTALVALTAFAISSTTGDAAKDLPMGCAVMTTVFNTIHLLFLTNPEKDFKHERSSEPIQALSAPRRLLWGFSVLGTPRNVGWNTEIVNLPPRPTTGRWPFVLKSLLRAAWFFLLIDIGQSYQHTNPIFSLTGPAAVSVKSQGYFWRCVNILAMESSEAYGMLSLQYTLLCALLVALGISEPQHCPSLFGSWADSYTLRRFWGRTWHQFMRRFMVSCGKYTSKLLGFKPGTPGSSYAQLYVAFAISAIIHSLGGDLMMGREWLGSSVPFFMSQAVAITFEDIVIAIVQHLGLKVPSRLAYIIGYIWVFVWFSVSMPSMSSREEMSQQNPSTMPNDLVLPEDIVETIIGELGQDKTTLRSTALTCKSFCRPSQRELFKLVGLYRQKDVTKLSQLFRTALHLASYVRRLILNRLMPNDIFPDDTCLDRFDPNLPIILHALTRLQGITMYSQVSWDGLPAELKAAFQTIFALPTLTEVTIGREVVFPASLLFRPEITRLDWGTPAKNQFCDGEAGHFSGTTTSRRFLRTLALPLSVPQWAFDWLTHPQCPISIQNLDVLFIYINLAPDRERSTLSLEILPMVSLLTLLHLDVNIEDSTRETIDLSSFLRLRELYIRFDAWFERVDAYNPIGWLIQTMRTLPLENMIQKIGFACDLVKENSEGDCHELYEEDALMVENDLPWGELDQLLNRPGMEALETVVWKVHKDLKPILLRSLTMTSQRGLLTFTNPRTSTRSPVGTQIGFDCASIPNPRN
ncbi:hypothetical protein BDN72DRAFT_961415 [Pluteus cervinus]|uniref:Uncharacterized protein n=1 Tax=Pluteus cervinus TaxID=181527 RepID=A0ACD3AN14_9AGAR|nr:hypothetical protein BDN72DRAFT_961415 [Pluteus cervinus]